MADISQSILRRIRDLYQNPRLSLEQLTDQLKNFNAGRVAEASPHSIGYRTLTTPERATQITQGALDNLGSGGLGGLVAATAYHGSPHLFASTAKNKLGEFLAPIEEGFLGKGVYLGSRDLANEYVHGLMKDQAKGYMYKVDIPDEHIANFLRTNTPFAQQPKAV